MRLSAPFLFLCLALPIPAGDVAVHNFDASRHHVLAGWPEEHIPNLLALAENPVRLEFEGKAGEAPTVHLHRVTSARKIPLDAPTVEADANGWRWTWAPPKTSGPVRYEVRFNGEPARVVCIESRDPEWLKTTLDMLGGASWQAHGLSPEERAALTNRGLHLGVAAETAKDVTASLQMIPKQGDASRRRVVWDKENHTLVVWRPGPASGDWDIRAPRWWISPAALATDHGLIRFLDLFSEPPLNP